MTGAVVSFFDHVHRMVDRLPRAFQTMARGGVTVWMMWALIITRTGPFFPIVALLLLITSATPLADLALVAAMAVVATAYGAIGEVIGAHVARQWKQRPKADTPRRLKQHLFMSFAYANLARLAACAPAVTLIALLAIAEHGAILLAGTVGVLVIGSKVIRYLRERAVTS